MCGIVGKVSFDGAPVDPAWLSHACELVAHRGPDGERTFVSGGGVRPSVGLGHRRLKVIDLKPSADQPMRNRGCVEAGRAAPLVIVFNGEIYNYQDLRRDLIARGHRLETDSDTEVILHLFEESGPDCVHALRGMFALAIWDERSNRLFLARDRVGKKPLYYRFDGRRFWFASEARAILADPDVPIEENPGAIRSYLTLGYVPGPMSAFRGLERVPPAHRVLVSDRGPVVERYWSLAYTPKLQVSEAEAIERVRHLLTESVRLRLVSDVPLGAFLSGGIDSSAVVAEMCRVAPGRVKTFSIGFEEAQFNELEYARLVADRYQTEHHEFVVKPDLETVLPRLAWHYGEPYADSSAVPTYHLARLARQHITVALNGDGGDESFAGYRRYVAQRFAATYRRLPRAIRALAQSAAALMPAAADSRSRLYDVRRFLLGLSLPPARRYASWFGFFEPDTPMLTPEFEAATAGEDPLALLARAFDEGRGLDPAEAAMRADVALYLPDDLLVKVDIATMADGLEARSPLLDQELMMLAAQLPAALKLPGRSTKSLLKKALSGIVPDEVLYRPKMGFGIPLDRWLREDLRDMARELLLGSQARERGCVRPEFVERLLGEHIAGRASHAHRIWALMMLELWHRAAGAAAREGRTGAVPAS